MGEYAGVQTLTPALSQGEQEGEERLVMVLEVGGERVPVYARSVEAAAEAVTRWVWWGVFVEPGVRGILQRIGKGTDGNGNGDGSRE